MTEPLSPLDPADPAELDPTDLAASVALDNESSDDQSDQPLDPAGPVATRIDEFRRISTAVAADIVAPEPAVRDAHLAAALAAFGPDEDRGQSTQAGESDPSVVALADRRQRAARRRWLAVAAAVAVVALAVPFVNAIRHQSSTVQTSASSASPPSTASEAAAPPVPADGPIAPDMSGSSTTTGRGAPIAGPLDPTTTGSVVISTSPPDLGSASSPQELAALVHTADPNLTVVAPNPPSSTQTSTASSTIAPVTPAAATCDATERVQYPGLGDLVLATTANYRGTPVDVLVYAMPSATGSSYRLLAVAPGDCTTVVDILL